VRLGSVQVGQSVAILGAGTIGLLSILVARAAGASDVFITARHPHQQEAARDLGASRVFPDTEALLQTLGTDGADCVIETVGGHAGTLVDAVQAVRPGGVVSMLGVFDGVAPIQALDFLTKEVTMVGSNCYGRVGRRSEFEIGIDLLGRNLDAARSLVTHTFTLDEINTAFQTAADKATRSIKVQIRPMP
jgi:threonine dehydrogenase-like Zn-dependent dehydrogenase